MRIVVLRALGLGDFLTGVPAYRALRRRYPDAEIVLAAPAALEPLRELLGGALDRIADTPPGTQPPDLRPPGTQPSGMQPTGTQPSGMQPPGMQPLARELHSAELAVNLHGSGPQSHRVLIAARPRALIAFCNDAIPQSANGPRFDAAEHEVVRWCRLLRHFGIAADPAELDLAVPPDPVPQHVRGATLIHPGAASEARRWPPERWADVARAEQRAGRTVILTGSPGEETDVAQRIADAAGVPRAHVYAGRTSLRELAALVAAAGRVVCGDTGVAHLATAYRTSSVVLFGPVAPSAWGPPPRPIHRALWNGTPGDPHANTVDAGLLAIRPEHVITALNELRAHAPAAAYAFR